MNKRRSDYPYARRYDPRDNSSAPILNVPFVVIHLVLVLAGVFTVLAFAPERLAGRVEFAAAVLPARFLAGPAVNGGVLGMLAPLAGHMFIHANLPHLAFNSFWLLAFGAPVARRFGAAEGRKSLRTFLGASIFVMFFVLCGMAGSLIYIAAHPHETTLLVGASGGIFGLLGGVVRFAFYRPSPLMEGATPIAPLTHPTVIAWTLFVILSNLMIGLFGGGFLGAGDAQIAWESHIGGYLFGLLTFGVFERAVQRL